VRGIASILDSISPVSPKAIFASAWLISDMG